MNKAAFYDLDGTLLSCNLVTMHAYYARNDRSILKSTYQLSKVVLSVPLLFGLPRVFEWAPRRYAMADQSAGIPRAAFRCRAMGMAARTSPAEGRLYAGQISTQSSRAAADPLPQAMAAVAPHLLIIDLDSTCSM